MRGLAVAAIVLFGFVPMLAAEEATLLNADFDNADLTGWRLSGDLCVAPAFCAGEPSGKYWIGFSTNSQKGDPITLCGVSSVEGMESILQSPYLPLPFAPSQVRVDFDVKFLTNENTDSDLGTDSFLVRLLTVAGPVVIAEIDDSGASPDTKNLKITGDAGFHQSKCSPTWNQETGMLHVSYYRTFREPVRSRITAGPVALEFLLNNHFDENFDSAVLVDNVRFRIYR